MHDFYNDYTTRRYNGNPKTTAPDGSLIGPYAVVLHHPETGRKFLEYALSLQKIPGLSLYAREVVIAVCGSRSKAAFENYAHHIIATQHAGITEAELKDIHAGICPHTLTEDGQAAFELATALGKNQVLDGLIWNKSVDVLGKDGAAAVIHYTAYYTMVGVILNGFDCALPSEVETQNT